MSDNLPVALCGHSPPKLAMLLLSPSYSDVAAPCSLSQESSQLKVLSQTEPQCYGHWGCTDLPSLKHHRELSWTWHCSIGSDNFRQNSVPEAVTHSPPKFAMQPAFMTAVLSRRLFNQSTFTEGAKALALSWRPPWLWCYHGGCHKCDAIVEASANTTLSQRSPQMWCYHGGCHKCSSMPRLLQMQHYHGGCSNILPYSLLLQLQHSHWKVRKCKVSWW